MVKLAEPRQRNRYTLVPRGKALYEDDARFGTKMLEKMGWSKGKGLGANEDGSKDFVRIRYKNDAQGLGFEARDDQWTQHEQSFNGLLESLNGNIKDDGAVAASNENNDIDSDVDMRPVGFGFVQNTTKTNNEKPVSFKAVISGESLEEKSKNSRARVHYKKFTRGKDLTQYSEKDLANIFGKKALQEVSNNETTNENHHNANNKNIKETESHFKSSALSIADYFKAKMENLDKHKQKMFEETSLNDDENDELKAKESIENQRNQKKRKRETEQVEEMKDEISLETLNKEKKEKQKKSKESKEVMKTAAVEEEETQVIEENISQQMNCKNNEGSEIKRKKKSKKKSEINVEEVDTIFLEQKETENVEKDAQKYKNEEETIKIKKKKKNKHEAITEKIYPDSEATIINSCESTTTKVKNSKKRKAKEVLNVEPMQENSKGLKKDCQKAMSLNSSEKPKNKGAEGFSDEERTITINSNITPKDDESLKTIKEIENALEAEKVYKLSSFAAEKFRFTDITGFNEANLNDIKGYGIDDNVQIEIFESEYDAKRISQLWSCTIDKYQFLTRPYSLFCEYEKKALEARKNKEKIPRFKAHQYRRKDAFKTIAI